MTNIQVEDLSDIKKKVIFEVPGDRVTDMIEAQYKDLKKNVQIKGFRKGKVPLDLIRSYFRKQVEADISRTIIDETFEPGLAGKKITAVSVVSLDAEDIEAGKPFRYTAEIEVPPPIEVEGYKGLSLTKTKLEVDEQEVEGRLEALRESQGQLAPLTEPRGVKEGDHLVIDAKAVSEGEELPSLTVTDYHMEIGREFYLPDFDSHLIGMVPGESKQTSHEFPEEYPHKGLAGKKAEFTITVKEVKERVLPDLDDDFAKDLGEYESLEDLKVEIRADIGRRLEQETQKEIMDQVVDLLLEKNQFDVPEAMIEGQIDMMFQQTLQGLAGQGFDPSRIPPPTQEQRDNIRPSAERSVKATLMLKAIGEQEKLEVSDEELEAGIEERASQMGYSADHLRDQLESNNMLENVRETLLNDKILKLVEDSADVTEKEKTEAQATDSESEKE